MLDRHTLEGDRIRLVPLDRSHHARLCEIGLDERLWRLTTIRVATPEEMKEYVEKALRAAAEGSAIPFVIVEKRAGEVVGTTRFHSIAREHRRLEIGFTWIAVPWQRTPVNTEARYLMLRHAFEELGSVRVEFKSDIANEPSCRALERIGAKREGTMRGYMISRRDGPRDIALFSILRDEWPEVKRGLERKLAER